MKYGIALTLILLFGCDSYAATVPHTLFSYNTETGVWTQLAGVPTETFKNAINAAGNTQAARDAKKAQESAAKAQTSESKAESDRAAQIAIAQEAARKANSDAAQARFDLAATRADAAAESAAIRSSQNRVIYGQYLTTLLLGVVTIIGGIITAKLNKHMVATAQQGMVIGEQGVAISRVEANTKALIAELIEKAHKEGKEEGKEEEKAKK